MVCVYCASLPAIIYTLLIFHHATTAAGCLFSCSFSRFARLYSFPSLSVSVSLSLSLSLAPSLTLCHTLSFCWWHSSCTFALASCAPQTVLHFIVYCGCPTRLAPCLCLPGIPRRGIVRRQLRLWLLLTQPFYSCSLLHCAALPPLPPSLYSSLFVPL